MHGPSLSGGVDAEFAGKGSNTVNDPVQVCANVLI